jgi:hypothetical protein
MSQPIEKLRARSPSPRVGMLFVVAMALCTAGAPLLAHVVTYKGTVTSVEKNKISLDVVDEKTKKVTPMSFGVDAETKVLRGDVEVKFADARIEKGEAVSVSLDIDDGGTTADVIRLPARK